MLILILTVTLAVIFLRDHFLSFRSQAPADYAGTEPAFSMLEHLGGPIIAEGVIYGPSGRVASRFVADMIGVWDGRTGTLSESFRYADGTTQQREWRLTLGEDGAFTATADDIVGEARGQVSGATATLHYRLVLPEKAGGHVLDVVDWMYLTEQGTIVNRSEMRKFGIKVAELVATMRPAQGR